MLFNIVAAAFILLGLTQAAPAPIEAHADANCPPLAPYLMSSDPTNAWFNICTAYDVQWVSFKAPVSRQSL